MASKSSSSDVREPHKERSRSLEDLLASAANLDAERDLNDDQVAFKSKAYPDEIQESAAKEHRERRAGTHFESEGRDDSANSVLLFPGQGTQRVGMAKRLLEEGGEVAAAVKPLYERASQLLDYDLLKVSFKCIVCSYKLPHLSVSFS